jgi:F-box-like
MKFLSLSTFIFWLSFNVITHCLCLASNAQVEASSDEPAKKRHRINDLSLSFESSFLEVDEWNTLPGELWIHIFNYLSFHNLEIAKSVCKAWQEIGNDEWLSLAKQMKTEPLSFLLKKLEDSKEGRDGFYQEFFDSPVALEKLLSDSRALEDILANSSLIPLLFKSKLTASAIYEALSKNTLEERQQTALEAYVGTAPIFSPKESLFSQAFITFAEVCAPLYKALYLLDLFNLPSAKPIKDLFKRADQEIKRQETFRNNNEEELILLPCQPPRLLSQCSANLIEPLG